MHGSHAPNSNPATNGHSTNGVIANGSSPSRGKGRVENSNGFANGGDNGHANGMTPRQKSLYRGHNRQEVVRLLMQTMQDLGYTGAAQALEAESHIELESPSVAALRFSVSNGEWADAEMLLLGTEDDGDVDGAAGAESGSLDGQHMGLPLKAGTDKKDLRFMIRKQKYLELLEQRDHGRALMVLRHELTPLGCDVEHLHMLSGLMVCPTPEDLKIQADWHGAKGGSREILLKDLSHSIHHSVMIPPNRLTNLLDQVKQHWVEKCVWHNPLEPFSLFFDHTCAREQFPLHMVQTLRQAEEVWYLEFSHDGQYLASCGESKNVIVYHVGGDWEERFTLEGHKSMVVCVTWSPDDKWLVTCSKDKTAKLWNASTGECLTTIDRHSEPVTSAAWVPNSSAFFTGSLDVESSLNYWRVEDLQHRKNAPAAFCFPSSSRVSDLAITPDGIRVVAISADVKLCIFNLLTRSEEYSVRFKSPLTCVRISKDGRYILLNLAEGELQCIELETMDVVQRYVGQSQGEYIIRSTWAGADENLVITGSRDGKIFVFHRERGTLIETLDGHGRGCANAIAWNKADACMFASAGDDHTVRIWSKGNYTPATTRRTSSEVSLLQATQPSVPGVDSERNSSSRPSGRYIAPVSSTVAPLL